MLIAAPRSPEVDFFSPTRRTTRFGYTCQSHLALEVYRHVFGAGLPWVWFATRFNASGNVESSNPARIYLDLSTAVGDGDVGSKLVRGYRASLLATAYGNALLADEVSRAAIEYFRPRIWLIGAEVIASRKGVSVDTVLAECRGNAAAGVASNPGQVLQPDEYLLKDLQAGEYAVIVDG